MAKCLDFSRERGQEGGALILSPGLFTSAPHSSGGDERKQSRENKLKKCPSSLEVDTDMVVRCAQVSVQTGDAGGAQDDPSLSG